MYRKTTEHQIDKTRKEILHILVKILKTQNKERALKAAREKD